MDEFEQIYKAREQADCLYDHHAVEKAIDRVAEQLAKQYRTLNPIIVCVMNGGLIFCGKLLTRLDFPLQVDYLHATRYRNSTQPTTLQWIVTPQQLLAKRHVIIVDDILDEGNTLISVIKSCQDQGAESVRCAVLVNKNHDRKADVDFQADFVGLETEDRYLFGYGMDYKGYWRNAPGIYAVNEI